jgi:hypothetical protein
MSQPQPAQKATTAVVAKKWYQDDEERNVNKNTKEAQRQLEFGPGVIGSRFDAINVKTQEIYEVGVLKLFLETEILKSATGSFEPGRKELYIPQFMTKPFIGTDLLFTSDVEFSDVGFLPGSLEDDRRKCFLSRFEFDKYLLRLPKPISDIETPLKEKRDSNAYKYLEILGSEDKQRILMICDKFDEKYRNGQLKILHDVEEKKKELSAIKLLKVDATMSLEEKTKKEEDKQKELTREENRMTKLETKRTNYKAACKIFSNDIVRMQYDATLVESVDETKKDATSLSKKIIEWLKYKQNSQSFLKEVFDIFKPVMSSELEVQKKVVVEKIQIFIKDITSLFEPIIKNYFYDTLKKMLLTFLPLTRGVSRADIDFIDEYVQPTNRINKPEDFSWSKIQPVLERVSKLQFTTAANKNTALELYSMSKFISNFQQNFLTMFTFDKEEKWNFEEIIKNQSVLLNTCSDIDILYNNIIYLSAILNNIENMIEEVRAQITSSRKMIPDGIEDFYKSLKKITDSVNELKKNVESLHLEFETTTYKTILGESSHSVFVESVFYDKVPNISNANKNNKFLVVSDFITNADGNKPVTIVIPSGYYDLETLSKAVEKELCKNCKWQVDAVKNENKDTIWSCKYDENNKMQLTLYFPDDVLMNNGNNIIPNIHDAYPVGYNGITAPNNIANNRFNVKVDLNMNGAIPNYSTNYYTLVIPQGEYTSIEQLLGAMENTINNFIGEKKYKAKIEIKKDETSPNHITFKFSKPFFSRKDEYLIINFDTNSSLNEIIGANKSDYYLNTFQQLPHMPQAYILPPLSKSVKIETRMKIAGEDCDASVIFGIPLSENSTRKIEIIPNIETREFFLEKEHNVKMSKILDGYFKISLYSTNSTRISDYGILNFTRKINNFGSVNLQALNKGKSNLYNSKFKNEILEKTGLYISNSILQPEVPVITYTDILNSLFYRYPCIPSVDESSSVVLKEGTLEFDGFIEKRVNVPMLKNVVWFGKNDNSNESLSFTIKKALENALMYSDCDDERSKLLCDLHYAICGPVFTDTVSKKQSRENNELQMSYQFQLEYKRPDIINPRISGPPPLPLPQSKPFTVKGITPYFDRSVNRYKYLIYGHYIRSDGEQMGCIKYYDPGIKIAPEPASMQLYDILVFDDGGASGSKSTSTVNTVVEVTFNYTSFEFIYPVFIIGGKFKRVIQNEIDDDNVIVARLSRNNYVVWTMGDDKKKLPSNNIRMYLDVNDVKNYSPSPYDSFEYCWAIYQNPPGVIKQNFDNFVRLSDFVNLEVIFVLNVYSVVACNCIVTKNMRDNQFYVYLPMQTDPSKIILSYVDLEINCGAISTNKAIYELSRKLHNLQNEFCLGSSDKTTITRDIRTLTTEIGNLTRANRNVVDSMLWIGLKKKHNDLDILSCHIINYSTGDVVKLDDLDGLIEFEENDTIEKIRVDINDPEVVTVFGKFTATIKINDSKFKKIRNAMVIYTNLENKHNNNGNYCNTTAIGSLKYKLNYDNFEAITVNLSEFDAYASNSCLDGLVVASNNNGTKQQNVGILLIKTNEVTPVVVGFHENKITKLKSDESNGGVWSNILCYDYSMCADTWMWDKTGTRATPVLEKGILNPLLFITFKTTLELGNVNRITELFYGNFVMITSKEFIPSDALSRVHVLNTWGIDLSSEYTPFYRRIFESDEGNKIFKMEIYKKYMDNVLDTIIGSAKEYYEDKIKNSIYNGEYGTAINSTFFTGGGQLREMRENSAAAMVVAKEVELKEIKKYESKEMQKQETSFIEIRVPDIMMSNSYLKKLSLDEKVKVRKYFFDALYKFSIKLKEIAASQSESAGQKGLAIKDEYRVVLCSSRMNLTNFEDMYKEKEVEDGSNIKSFFEVTSDLYDYDVDESKDGIKNVILVNQWNERGFIGDYGAFAKAYSKNLTPNQMIVSKTMKEVNAAVAVSSDMTQTEYVPMNANTSFLMNPFIAYGTFDLTRWKGFRSVFEKASNVKMVQKGVVQKGVVQKGGVDNELRRQLLKNQQQARYLSPTYASSYAAPYASPYAPSSYGLFGPYSQEGRSRYDGLMTPYDERLQQYDPMYRQMSQYYYDDDNPRIKFQSRVIEKTTSNSDKLKEDRMRVVDPMNKLKRIVLWLCDFVEGKMLMVKSFITKNDVILTLPTQSQLTTAKSGTELLNKLCQNYFHTEMVLRKWELQYTYNYTPTETGIFIYNAKTSDLPKETTSMVYVSMKAIYNLANDVGSQNDKTSISIFEGDKDIILEVFKVFKLISGGIISPTSKEFNEIRAQLVSKTVPPHLQSVISATKRKKNVEANVNFLINLFFSPNNLFFARGNIPYYIYSTQRNCKIYTIIKQKTYDDDSYLTCLKLFLQTQQDFNNQSKDKTGNLRVGCAVKKKLINDNFSAVWDNFWNDLIESEEQVNLNNQLIADVNFEKGSSEKEKDKETTDDKIMQKVCLEFAKANGEVMRKFPVDWDTSKYYPVKYNYVYYNIDESEKYKFNNEYFYILNYLSYPTLSSGSGAYVGLNCIKYRDRDGENPLLFLGLSASAGGTFTGVYIFDLKRYKLTKFIETNGEVLCMDILDINEGNENSSYMLIGGNFSQVTTFSNGTTKVSNVSSIKGKIVMVNLKTYEVLKIDNITTSETNDEVQKVCICKDKRIVKAKGVKTQSVEGYVAIVGGSFAIEVTNPNNSSSKERLINIGCIIIKKKDDGTGGYEANLVAVDSRVARIPSDFSGVASGLTSIKTKITSIVCQYSNDSSDNSNGGDDSKSETVFFIGGGEMTIYNNFDQNTSTVKASNCNGIVKLTLKSEFNSADNMYNQVGVIESVSVNNTNKISLVSFEIVKINSIKYLFCLTTFVDATIRLNIFNLELKLQSQPQMSVYTYSDVPYKLPKRMTISNQTLLQTRDGDKNILVMSVTFSSSSSPLTFVTQTFTCSVVNLNERAAPVIVESVTNPNLPHNFSVTDMVYLKDTREVYIAKNNLNKGDNNILTVRSNYQKIGEWKMKDKGESEETAIVAHFIEKSSVELMSIFQSNPSMVLFLQNIDFRNFESFGNIDEFKKKIDAINASIKGLATPTLELTSEDFESPCVDICKKVKSIVKFINDFTLKNSSISDITKTVNEFVNNLLFMLLYTGCNKLLITLCDYYQVCLNNFVTAKPTSLNWTTEFEKSFTEVKFIVDLIKKIGIKSIQFDIEYDFNVCSNPKTNTGIAYLVYNYNLQLEDEITPKYQDNIKNKIYEFGEDSSSSISNKFYETNVIDKMGNTHTEISYCSFYKFERLKGSTPTFFGEIGNNDSKTIYVSMNIDNENVKFTSSEVFDFLNTIREYFGKLKAGNPSVDIGISGPIKRITIGGDFGCDLLSDVEVCKKFKAKQMKVYTMEENKNAMTYKEEQTSKEKKTNHLFVVDVDLERQLTTQFGGGSEEDEEDNQVNQNKKRICIGAPIENGKWVSSNKRKTRRKLPLLMSSS